jgi:hypothetical protein
LKFFKHRRGARYASARPHLEIDRETREILEDGSDEELAEWIQLSRATRDRETPCAPQDETCSF